MKNIGSYIYESRMFEAEEIPEKYKDQLVNLVQMIVNSYEDNIDNDWDEDDLRKYIKKTVKGIEGEALEVLTKACIETAKQLDNVPDEDEDDDEIDENLYSDSYNTIFEKKKNVALDYLQKIRDAVSDKAKDAGVDVDKIKKDAGKAIKNLEKGAEQTMHDMGYGTRGKVLGM